MKITSLFFLFSIATLSFSQNSQFIEENIIINNSIDGTLLTPKSTKPPLVIIIAGSGPLDRNGNTNFLKGNTLKKLAEALGNNDIASYRYDKYSLRQIRAANFKIDYTFDIFIEDAKSVIDYFKTKNSFSKIIVLGHSQGSLVGMLAAKDKADGFISIAGPGQPIDDIITYQIGVSSPLFYQDTKRVFGILKEGKTTDDFPPALASIFNKPTQPFMISWMKYNPQVEINKLNIPVLIVNGTKDIQITVSEAELLQKASMNCQLVIIDKMNHALVPIEGDRLENVKSYNEANRPLSNDLIEALIAFIK